VSVSVEAIAGLRSKETDKGVCHFHDKSSQDVRNVCPGALSLSKLLGCLV
jgi:hypothetical protein